MYLESDTAHFVGKKFMGLLANFFIQILRFNKMCKQNTNLCRLGIAKFILEVADLVDSMNLDVIPADFKITFLCLPFLFFDEL